jgi:hypothetical protein
VTGVVRSTTPRSRVIQIKEKYLHRALRHADATTVTEKGNISYRGSPTSERDKKQRDPLDTLSHLPQTGLPSISHAGGDMPSGVGCQARLLTVPVFVISVAANIFLTHCVKDKKDMLNN